MSTSVYHNLLIESWNDVVNTSESDVMWGDVLMHLAPSSGHCVTVLTECDSQVVISWAGCVMKASLVCVGVEVKLFSIQNRTHWNSLAVVCGSLAGCALGVVSQRISIKKKLLLQEMKEFLEWRNHDSVRISVIPKLWIWYNTLPKYIWYGHWNNTTAKT